MSLDTRITQFREPCDCQLPVINPATSIGPVAYHCVKHRSAIIDSPGDFLDAYADRIEEARALSFHDTCAHHTTRYTCPEVSWSRIERARYQQLLFKLKADCGICLALWSLVNGLAGTRGQLFTPYWTAHLQVDVRDSPRYLLGIDNPALSWKDVDVRQRHRAEVPNCFEVVTSSRAKRYLHFAGTPRRISCPAYFVSSMIPTPRLACEQCKKRKIRCNKGSPCSACKHADLQCHTVQRARLPRGKSGKSRAHNTQLEDRVARIESLLAQQSRVSSESSSISSSDEPTRTATSMFSSNYTKGSASVYFPAVTVASFVASEFWTALSEEVQGLRETIENTDDGLEDFNNGSGFMNEQDANDTSSPCAILFRQTRSDTMGRASRLPSHAHMELLEVFRMRVDSVYKILHWPSVLSKTHASSDGLRAVSSTSRLDLLETSICFMAICSITDDEARTMGLGVRLEALQTYRSAVEALLAKSNLLTNPNLTELQAFVIYLVR